MISTLKKFVMNLFFSKGHTMSIWKGPLKGYKYVVKPDTGFSSLVGRWEKESQLIYMNSIKKGDIVFDLGANFGIHSMLYSKLVGSQGMVYSFEPLPENIKDLNRHVQLNHIDNIKIVETAISDNEAYLHFKLAQHGGQGSLIGIGRESGEVIKVKTTTLNKFISTVNVLPDFVKIDIEGAEGLALKGFNEKVKESYPFFAIDLHNPECDLMVGEFLQHHGYEVYRVVYSSVKDKIKYKNRLQKILLLNEPYPHPEGIWGVIWAVHPTRKSQVAEFIKNHI